MKDIAWVRKISPNNLKAITGIRGEWCRWINPSKNNHGMIFGMGRIPPGEDMGWHQHPEPEVFFVLSGNGEAYWKENNEEKSSLLQPGVAFFKIGEIPHQMLNTGSEPLIGIAFKVAKV